jgi:hypothetical protein
MNHTRPATPFLRVRQGVILLDSSLRENDDGRAWRLERFTRCVSYLAMSDAQATMPSPIASQASFAWVPAARSESERGPGGDDAGTFMHKKAAGGKVKGAACFRARSIRLDRPPRPAGLRIFTTTTRRSRRSLCPW